MSLKDINLTLIIQTSHCVCGQSRQRLFGHDSQTSREADHDQFTRICNVNLDAESQNILTVEKQQLNLVPYIKI